ncbi:hypothetical protein ACFQX6_34460 [Streptosporangium lutulentum]
MLGVERFVRRTAPEVRPRLDALVSLTHRTQLWCAQSLKDAAPRLATIPNALPSGYRPRSGLDTRTLVIAGRLVGEKRVDHAVRAFALIAAGFPTGRCGSWETVPWPEDCVTWSRALSSRTRST